MTKFTLDIDKMLHHYNLVVAALELARESLPGSETQARLLSIAQTQQQFAVDAFVEKEVMS